MTREDFKKNFIDGDFEIPRIGHYRIEKKNNYFISYHEFGKKDTLVVYKTFKDLWNSNINGKLFSDFVKNMEDVICFVDDYDKEAIEATGKLFV